MSALDKLGASNPYANASEIYRESPWQSTLTGFLGLRTQADAWRENMQIQANEYNAALAQKAYDEEYNLPVNSVARLRAAGINPDLDGGKNIDPGSAQPLGEDPSTPMQSTGEDSVIMEFANNVFGAFSTAVGLIQGVQGVQFKHLQNTMQAIQNETAFKQFTEGLWPYMLPDSPDPTFLGPNQTFDWKGAALINAQKFAGHLPSKMQDKFLSQIQQYWESGPGQAESYEMWKKRVQERRNFYSERGTFYSDIDNVLDDIVGPLNEMSEKIFKNRQNLEVAQSESAEVEANYNKEYFAEADGKLAAENENSLNRREKSENDTVAVLNETIERITDALDHTRQSGGVKGGLASIALALMAGIRLWLVNVGAPSISRSSSASSGIGSGSGIYQNQSSSRGFSIGF